MERMQRVYEKALVAWAENRPEAVVYSGDLTNSTEIGLFKATYPDRFFSMGLSEQNMVSWAGGMAREGFVPFLHTFAVFMYRRAYDQLAMSVAYPKLKVRLVGFLPGVMTPGGVSHQAIEDISVLRGLPNLTIVEMGDATEVESILPALENVDGPVYLRMLRGEIPRLFDPSLPFQLGKARCLATGNEICLISSGICTEHAMYAAQALQGKGVSVGHLHISTFKPFDAETVASHISRAKYGVITVENHNVIGGLATCVAEAMAANQVAKPLRSLGLHDEFAHGSSAPYLIHKFEMDAEAIVRQVEALTGKSYDIDATTLAPTEFRPYEKPMEQLEAL